MDSKAGYPSSSSYDDELVPPPSYTDSVPLNHNTSSFSKLSDNTSQYYTAQIQSQLQDLTSAINSVQTQKTLISDALDQKVLSLLAHQIQLYLSDFAKSGLERGALILVPKQGLDDENALPSRYDFKDPEHFDKVIRVSDKEGTSSNDYNNSSYSDDSSQQWYWQDADMARRLAGYLRPAKEAEIPPPPRPVIKKVVTQPQSPEPRRVFWSRKREVLNFDGGRAAAEASESAPEKVAPRKGDGDKVIMEVNAEEVTFRTESELGLLETKTGWAVVLKLRVILGRK